MQLHLDIIGILVLYDTDLVDFVLTWTSLSSGAGRQGATIIPQSSSYRDILIRNSSNERHLLLTGRCLTCATGQKGKQNKLHINL